MGRNSGKSLKREFSFIELNPEYAIIYHQLRKEARVWNSTSQYWLGRECERRADALLRGDLTNYKSVKHSETLYFS
jgi:hypothetical protein